MTIGSGWALAVDAATWLLAALLLLPVTIPPRRRRRRGTRHHAGAAGGVELLLGDPVALGRSWWASVCSTAIHAGAWFTLGPVVADDTIGRQGWGYVLSAEAAGLLAHRGRAAPRPARATTAPGACSAIALRAPPMLAARRLAHPGRPRHGGLPRGCRHRDLRHGLEPRHAGEHRGPDARRGPTPTTRSAPSSRCRSDSSPRPAGRGVRLRAGPRGLGRGVRRRVGLVLCSRRAHLRGPGAV